VCGTSRVSPEQSVLCIPVRSTDLTVMESQHVVLLQAHHDKHTTEMDLSHKNSKWLKACMAAPCKEVAIPALASAQQQMLLVFEKTVA